MKEVSQAYAQLNDGGQIHYRYAGDPANPAIVLLHQTPSHSAMYLPLMAQLDDHFFVIAPDTPGFGSSDRLTRDCKVEAFAAYLLEFLGAIDIETCMLFGHHTGAAIAVQMAFDEPERFNAVALSGPTLLSDAQREALHANAETFAPEKSGGHFMKMWQRISGKDASVCLNIVEREVLSALACGDYYLASYRAVCAQDFAAQLPVLSCPVLTFAGDKDVLSSAVEPTLALLRDGRSAILPSGAGTYACEQFAPEVALILRDFFTSVTVPGGQ
ncbi:MAG: alpha/beta hydrolase [Halioglobus sp.]